MKENVLKDLKNIFSKMGTDLISRIVTQQKLGFCIIGKSTTMNEIFSVRP
jgi:hypothetical protein